MKKTQETAMFSNYPDVVSIKELCTMLGGVGPKAAYRLLHNGDILYFRIGKAFRIPKQSVIDFLSRKNV